MLSALNYRLAAVWMFAPALVLSGCASTSNSTTPLTLEARVNNNSPLANKPFPVRIVIAGPDNRFTTGQRSQLTQALRLALNARGYTVGDNAQAASGVVRVSYTLDKAVMDDEQGWSPSVGIFSGYGIGRVGFGFGTEIPINRQRTRRVDELSITAFDENAGWVWNTTAQVASGARGVAVYPDMYQAAEAFLGKETDRVLHLPQAETR